MCMIMSTDSSPMINVAMQKLKNYNRHVIQILLITFSMGRMDVQIIKSLGSVTVILLI